MWSASRSRNLAGTTTRLPRAATRPKSPRPCAWPRPVRARPRWTEGQGRSPVFQTKQHDRGAVLPKGQGSLGQRFKGKELAAIHDRQRIACPGTGRAFAQARRDHAAGRNGRDAQEAASISGQNYRNFRTGLLWPSQDHSRQERPGPALRPRAKTACPALRPRDGAVCPPRPDPRTAPPSGAAHRGIPA